MTRRFHRGERQAKPIGLVDVAQLALLPPGSHESAGNSQTPRIRVPFTIELVRAQPHEGAALRLCMTCGGYEQDDLATALKVDFGTFSKVINGKAQLSWAKICLAMDLCGNEIPLLWRVESRSYDSATLRKLRSELEQQIADLEASNQKKDEKIQILTDVIAGRVRP